MADKKEQEQLDEAAEQAAKEMADALDFGGDGSDEVLRGAGGRVEEDKPEDKPWEDDSEEKQEEEQSDEEQKADETEEEDEEVATKEPEESTEDAEQSKDGVETYTLDGKKYTAEEIAADPKLLGKMTTHYNQVGNLSKLLDEERGNLTSKDEAIAALEAEKQQIQDEWVRAKMALDAEANKSPVEEAKPVERPSTKVLTEHFRPVLDQMKEDGRLSEDEIDEHSGLVAEYLFDTIQTRTTVEEVAKYFAKEIDQIKQFINPAIQTWSREEAIRADASTQKEAASLEGYQDLDSPENWESLKEYITKKIANSPKNSDGSPQFDPVFDAETMREQWDAMQGAAMRKALAATKAAAEKQQKEDARKAGGSAASGGKTPKKKPKPKKPLTPQEEALDFGDGKYAG
jgi:hypothetical protein